LAARIHSLEDTVTVLRAGASKFAVENVELRTEIACFHAGETAALRAPASPPVSRAARRRDLRRASRR
jgi:hypothetical protein